MMPKLARVAATMCAVGLVLCGRLRTRPLSLTNSAERSTSPFSATHSVPYPPETRFRACSPMTTRLSRRRLRSSRNGIQRANELLDDHQRRDDHGGGGRHGRSRSRSRYRFPGDVTLHHVPAGSNNPPGTLGDWGYAEAASRFSCGITRRRIQRRIATGKPLSGQLPAAGQQHRSVQHASGLLTVRSQLTSQVSVPEPYSIRLLCTGSGRGGPRQAAILPSQLKLIGELQRVS